MSRCTRSGTLKELDAKTAEIERLRQENDDASSAKEKAAAEIERLRQENDAASSAKEKAATEIERLRQENDAASSAKEEAAAEIERLRQQLKRKRKSNTLVRHFLIDTNKSSNDDEPYKRFCQKIKSRKRDAKYWTTEQINDFKDFCRHEICGPCRFGNKCRTVKLGEICRFDHKFGYHINETERISALRKSRKAPLNTGTIMCYHGDLCTKGMTCTFRH
tara:strand:- start:6123 stop:6782 length:660 start_codon:yes stop_codon:yes gene_type:complete